jgi:hypothetical protein
MRGKVIAALLTASFLLPGLANAVTEEDFTVKTTQNLINLCSASADDPHRDKAIHFCHGFVVGAYQYYEAAEAGPQGKRLVCLPNPHPTRNQGIAMFVEWAKAHSQYMGDLPVETGFRFMMEKWPCKK